MNLGQVCCLVLTDNITLKYIAFVSDNVGQGEVNMISRIVTLGKQEKTFGFKFDASTNTDCDLNALTYKTDVIDYTTGNIIYDELVAGPVAVFLIPNEKFLGENSFAQTYTKNNSLNSAEPCAKLGYLYRTNATGKTQYIPYMNGT